MKPLQRLLFLGGVSALALGLYCIPFFDLSHELIVSPMEAGWPELRGPSKAIWGKTDVDGEPLPPGALARLGSTRFRHQARVHAYAMSPEGNELATEDSAGTIALWQFPHGKLLRRTGGYWDFRHFFQSDECSVAYRANGSQLVLACSGSISFLDAHSLNTIKQVTTDFFDAPLLSPDGRFALLVSREHLLLWDCEAGREIQKFPKAREPEHLVLSDEMPPKQTAAFSPDGTWLAISMPDYSILLYGLRSGKTRSLRGHEGRLDCLAFCMDRNKLFSAGHFVHVWDLASGRIAHRFPAGREIEKDDWLAYFLEKTKDRERKRVKYRPRVSALAATADGRHLAAYTTDNKVVLWDTAKACPMWSLPAEEECSNLRFSRAGRYLLATSWKGLHVWEAARGLVLHPAEDQSRDISLRDFTTDGTCIGITVGRDRGKIWNPRSGQCEDGERKLRQPALRALAKRNDDHSQLRLLIQEVSSGRTVREISLACKKSESRLEQLFETDCTAVSPSGKILVCATHDNVYCWRLDTNDNKPAWIISTDEGHWRPSSFTFTPDEAIVALRRTPTMWLSCGCSADIPVDVRFLDVHTGKELTRFNHLKRRCEWLVFSPDNKVLATNGLDTHHAVQLWNRETGALVHTLTTEHSARCAALLPDGRSVIAGCSDGSLWMWECQSGGLRKRWRAHEGLIGEVIASPDGRLLASGCSDGTALLWELYPATQTSPRRAADTLWSQLAAPDSGQAYTAMVSYWSQPEFTERELAGRLHPVPAGSQGKILDSIHALDSKQFRDRERATSYLRRNMELAYPHLLRAASSAPSLEVERRISGLLRYEAAGRAERMRQSRAVEVLERLATDRATSILQQLSAGDPSLPLTQDANQSFNRLLQRRTAHGRDS